MFVIRRPLQRVCRAASLTWSRSLASLLVEPASSLLDEEVTVSGCQLEPGSEVRLETLLEDREQRFHFQSVCHYQTDDSGEFSTARQPPLPASQYRGLHRSGPLWSLQPCPGSRPRLWPEDIRKALQYQLSLSCPQSGQVLATARAEKYFLTQAVRRVEVREGPLRAVLFLPPRPGPAIITMYGGTNKGQVPEDRAALLASYGYVTLALAFYGVADLPSLYDSFDMNYFELAIDWLLAQPQVTGDRLGLFGSSTGGNLALSIMSSTPDKVAACVVSGAAFASLPGHTFYHGQIIVEKTGWKMEEDWENPFGFRGGLQAMLRSEAQQIKFENCPAPLLVLVGEEDNLYREADEIAHVMLERAERAGKRNMRVVRYPGTGHLIDLPHSPFCSLSKHPMLPPDRKFNYGGQPQPQSLAQIEAWKTMFDFFKDNLLNKPD